METPNLPLQNLQNVYSQLRFYLAFYFKITIGIYIYVFFFLARLLQSLACSQVVDFN